MRNPRDFFKPLAIDAPDPLREIPFLPSRMIHFLDFSNEKMVAKVPQIAPTLDILLGNLEDAVPVDHEIASGAADLAARHGDGAETIDYVIAATALRLGADLLTRDVAAFPMFGELRAAY